MASYKYFSIVKISIFNNTNTMDHVNCFSGGLEMEDLPRHFQQVGHHLTVSCPDLIFNKKRFKNIFFHKGERGGDSLKNCVIELILWFE